MDAGVRRLMLAVACAVLAGCAGVSSIQQPVSSTVRVEHSLATDSSGTTYAFQPLAGQADDPTYAAAQAELRRKLAAQGWHELPPASAQVLVAVDYGVEAESGSAGSSVTNDIGAAAATSAYESSEPRTAARPPTMTEVPSYGTAGFVRTGSGEYVRTVRLVMADRLTVERGTWTPVYEATLRSTSASANLDAVLPALLDAIFATFPGTSGETRRERTALR